MTHTSNSNPGPGFLDGMDNSVSAIPPSWRTGPSGSISTGTHSESGELTGEHVFAGRPPSITSHWHASSGLAGGMPVIASMPPPEISPLSLHQLEQQFLHTPIQHVPSQAFPSQDQVIMELRNEIAELKTRNKILDAQYTTLFFAHISLLNRIPNPMGSNVVGPLEQANYPDVKFWHSADWTNFCANRNVSTIDNGGAGGANPQPTAMRYVEDERGHAVTGDTVDMMRSFAHNIWRELGISGAAKTSWAQVDVQSKKRYYHAMASGFFNLRLCDSDWKAEKIAEDNYTLWHLRRCPPTQEASQSKRVRNTSTVPRGRSKKSKVKSNLKESSGNPNDQDRDNVMRGD